MTQDNYIPNGKLQGDTKEIPMTGEAQAGNYSGSLDGEVSKSHLGQDAGFKPLGDIGGSTGSDGMKGS